MHISFCIIHSGRERRCLYCSSLLRYIHIWAWGCLFSFIHVLLCLAYIGYLIFNSICFLFMLIRTVIFMSGCNLLCVQSSIKYKKGSHTDSVLGLAWNKEFRFVEASVPFCPFLLVSDAYHIIFYYLCFFLSFSTFETKNKMQEYPCQCKCWQKGEDLGRSWRKMYYNFGRSYR